MTHTCSKTTKQRLVTLLNKGRKLFDALDACQLSYQAYRRARDLDPSFGIAVDNARAKHYEAVKSKGVLAGGYIPKGYG